MPSLSRIKEHMKLKAERDRIAKIHKSALNDNDKKLKELMEKRKEDEKTAKESLEKE